MTRKLSLDRSDQAEVRSAKIERRLFPFAIRSVEIGDFTEYRPDLVTAGIGNGFHGFSYTLPDSLKDGQFHAIRVKVPGGGADLSNTPRTIGCSGAAAIYEGNHEAANCNVISGWAWDQRDPESPINVAIFDGNQLIATVLAIQFRQDLVAAGNGYHAFSFNVPQSLKNNQPHQIVIKYSRSSQLLAGTNKTITCSPWVFWQPALRKQV